MLYARLCFFLETTQEAGERGMPGGESTMLVLVPALFILLSLVPFDADSYTIVKMSKRKLEMPDFHQRRHSSRNCWPQASDERSSLHLAC